MFYHGSNKKRHKDQVRKVAFTLQFLGDRTKVFFTAHVISEIVAQTDVIIKKPVRTRVFSWFWGHRRLWPPNQEKHGIFNFPLVLHLGNFHDRHIGLPPFLIYFVTLVQQFCISQGMFLHDEDQSLHAMNQF